MGKNPAAQFYWNEWARDLEEHPLEIEGAWVRICGKLWYSKECRGKLTLTLDQWSRVLRVGNADGYRILTYLCTENVGDFPSSVTDDPNGKVTVICRRMYREETAKINNALRQQRYKERRKGNAVDNSNGNGKVTTPSSPSPSSSLKEKNKKAPLPTKEEIQESSDPKVLEDIETVTRQLYDEKVFPEVNAFKNKMLKGKNPRAVLHTLSRCYLAKPEDPWAYCKKIIELEHLNYNERDHQKTAR